MAHFSNHILFKICDQHIRLSIRLNDFCVVEHFVLLEDFESILRCSSEQWIGKGTIRAKNKNNKVFIRFLSETHNYVYSFPSRAFSEMCNEYLFQEGN